jgi:UDP-N-acetylmuramoylalanine-D-glutamate ligase
MKRIHFFRHVTWRAQTSHDATRIGNKQQEQHKQREQEPVEEDPYCSESISSANQPASSTRDTASSRNHELPRTQSAAAAAAAAAVAAAQDVSQSESPPAEKQRQLSFKQVTLQVHCTAVHQVLSLTQRVYYSLAQYRDGQYHLYTTRCHQEDGRRSRGRFIAAHGSPPRD